MGRTSRKGRRLGRRKAAARLADDGYLLAVRAALLEGGLRVDSCIASTRVLVALAERAGVEAAPLSVQVAVYNPVFARWFREHGTWTCPDPEVRRLGEVGGRVVAAGVGGEGPPTPGRWDGHLVTVMPVGVDEVRVVDLSADQVSRPLKGIDVRGPWQFVAPEAWLAGGLTVSRHHPLGSALSYRARPRDQSYRVAPDWAWRPDLADLLPPDLL